MSAGKGIFDQVPDTGITKKSELHGNDGVRWTVDIAVYSLSSGEARQLAAELLNLADMADKFNEQIAIDKAAK